MAWTNIDDSFLEPGKPVRSADLIALRDNPIAVAAGEAGAPGVASAALTDYPWGAEDFQTGTPERDWVLARNSGLSVGAVGSYAFLMITIAGTYGPGSTRSGGNLLYSNINGDTGSSAPGTWRCMGLGTLSTTLWLRIS